MFNFIHRLTYCPIHCKHRDVHRLPLPWSLQCSLRTGRGWNHKEIKKKQLLDAQYGAMDEQVYGIPSVPIPGPKDATTGLLLLCVNPPLVVTPGPTIYGTPIPGSSKSGRDTGMDMSG